MDVGLQRAIRQGPRYPMRRLAHAARSTMSRPIWQMGCVRPCGFPLRAKMPAIEPAVRSRRAWHRIQPGPTIRNCASCPTWWLGRKLRVTHPGQATKSTNPPSKLCNRDPTGQMSSGQCSTHLPLRRRTRRRQQRQRTPTQLRSTLWFPSQVRRLSRYASGISRARLPRPRPRAGMGALSI